MTIFADSDQSERRARVTWSLIAEPSDPVALLARARIGPRAALELARSATPREALAALGHDLPGDPAIDGAVTDPSRRIGQALDRWRLRLCSIDVGEELDRAAARGIYTLVSGDPQWPRQLDDLDHASPHCLWVHGPGDMTELAEAATVAVVGSRASTPYGEDCAASMASTLAARGVAVISGGAYGIDAAAHRGALAADDAPTVAVLAGGLDELYPRGNIRLLETIRERFVLVSEAPPGTAPTRWRFLSRNRVIAALAQATVVVEASWRSGALSTARHADDLSRPVAAVPGPVTSAASAGCHRLIRERGAVLVTDAADVVDLLPGAAPSEGSPHAVQDELDLLTPADRRVLDAVPPRSSTTTDAVARAVGVSVPSAAAAVARLELLGLVEMSGDRVRRRRATP